MSEDNVAQGQQHEDSVRYGLHYSQIAIGYFVAFQQHDAVLCMMVVGQNDLWLSVKFGNTVE
jgi:hypothetical protein